MIHICLKTCNVCSTKYICKTQQDPYKYEGSGTEWKEHNKRCGINHTTEILFSSDSIKEVELFCEEYERQNPEYWKTSDNANMIMERGGYNNSGKANPNYKHGRATGWKSDKRIQKSNDKWRNAEYHENNREKERARMRFYHHRTNRNTQRAQECYEDYKFWGGSMVVEPYESEMRRNNKKVLENV